MVGVGIEEQAGTGDNPLNQPVILKLVLNQVKKVDVTELQKCRLVSQSWNKAAVQILEESGYTMHLNNERIVEFKTLLEASERSRPRSAGNTESKQASSLRLSLTITPNLFDEDEDTDTNILAETILLAKNPHIHVNSVHFIFDPDFDPLEMKTNRELFALLDLTSNDLTSFKLDHYDQHHPRFEKFDFKGYLALDFPKLTSIEYNTSHDAEIERGKRNVKEMVDLTRHVFSVIQRAPKLSKLTLKVWEGSEQRSTNSVHTMLQACAINLEQLDIQLVGLTEEKTGENLLKIMSRIAFPKLTVLKLRNFELPWITKEFNRLLYQNCLALTSLEIYLEWKTREVLEEDKNLEFEFPILPNILHFGLHTNYYQIYQTSSAHLQHIYTIFARMVGNFSSLQSMCVDVGILFMIANHWKESRREKLYGQYPVFSNISTLEVQIPSNNILNFDVLLNKTIELYLYTFPNIENVVIKPDANYLNMLNPNNLASRSIDLLTIHPRITSLEIHNYGKPWLEKIPKIARAPNHGLKNLKLLPPRPSCPSINVEILLRRFPSLEFLQYGGESAIGADNIKNARFKIPIFLDKKREEDMLN